MESQPDANEIGIDSLTLEENKVEAYNQYCSTMTNEDESIYSLEGFARSKNYNNPTKVNNITNTNDNKVPQRTNQCK